MLEDALRTRLLADTEIASLIGERMFVNEAPQGIERPYVVYMVVSLMPQYGTSCVYDEMVIQYSCFAEKYADARSVVNAIRNNIGRFSGKIGPLHVPKIRFHSQGANEREKDSRLAHISYDFEIILNKN
jgi:hypothetical protein